MGHGRGSDLLRGEGLRDLADLAALELPHVVGKIGHYAEGAHASVREIGPPFRRNDLGRHRRRVELEAREEPALERAGVLSQEPERVVRADRAGELARETPRREAKLLEPVPEA